MKCLHKLRAWKKWKSLQHEMKDLKPEDLLHRIGLEVHHGIAHHIPAAVGIFALGALLGAGVAFCVAPASGRQLRHELMRLCRSMKQKNEDYENEPGDSAAREEHQFEELNQNNPER